MVDRELSVVLPCLDEELAIGQCLDQIRTVIQTHNLDAEVVVVDNGSTDSSRRILEEYAKNFPELRITEEVRRGYGLAYLKGFSIAEGKYIFMMDADGTYDFKDIPRFLEEISMGYDLIVGNRFASRMEKGVMPLLHRYIGNPILSFITRIFFKLKIHDIHCGARMIRKEVLSNMALYTAGMEFASEMIVKASRQDLKISEVPISYHTRIGKSKLKSFSDGWRHLRFLLLYSPLFLFIIPGLFLLTLGVVSMIALYFFEISILGLQLYFHPMFISSLLILVGYQLIFFGGFSKIYAVTHLGDEDRIISRLFRYITIERAGIAGAILGFIGGAIYTHIFWKWLSTGFGSLNEVKNSIVALTMIVIGVETLFSAFMLSTLGIKER